MKHLLIVQDKPTQFDVPLYHRIAEKVRDFQLSVLYTQCDRSAPLWDPEIVQSPQWDHIQDAAYDYHKLTRQQAHPKAAMAWIRKIRPDYVLISGYFPALHRRLARLLKKQGIPIGLRSDNTLLHSHFSGWKGLAKKILLPRWLRRYDAWHPVGSLAREYLIQVAGIQKPIFPFPYAVDNDWFFERSEHYRKNLQKALAALGFPEDAFVVLGILKWHAREDPLTLIDGFIAFAQHNHQARLILVGDGPLREKVKECLAPLKDRVYLPGYVPYSQLPRWYALAQAFVHPALGEPWGVSVNEALACGVPTIASAGVGAAYDLIEEGKTGFVFPSGDAGALAQCLRKLAAFPDQEQLQTACREKMRHWHYDRTIAAFREVLYWQHP